RPVTDLMGVQPSYMQEIPTGDGTVAQAAVGIVFLGEFLIGPEGEIVSIGKHAAEAMAEHKVTEAMVRKAMQRGKRFYDPKNKSVVYVLEKGMVNGKDLAIARDAATGELKTVMVNPKAIRPRFIPLN